MRLRTLLQLDRTATQMGNFKWLRVGLTLCFFVGLGVVVPLFGYRLVDESGRLVHHHGTPVWIHGDWLVGEYRECDMITTTPMVEGLRYSNEELEHLPRLYCSEISSGFGAYTEAFVASGSADTNWSAIGKNFHVMPVRYFGRLERPGKFRVNWWCQRNAESLTCKALN